jgi:hypothetical protein
LLDNYPEERKRRKKGQRLNDEKVKRNAAIGIEYHIGQRCQMFTFQTKNPNFG